MDRIPLRWHVGQPNFGDDYNPFLFENILDFPVRFEVSSAPHLLCAGSILERSTSSSIICGSGFIFPDSQIPDFHKVISVRGEYSASRLGVGSALIGDPFVIMSLYCSEIKPEKTRDITYIPHVNFFVRRGRSNLKVPEHVCVLDLGAEFDHVLETIASSKLIVSESLHGLVLADAFGVPNIWIAPSSDMLGGEYKFRDYYSSTSSPKKSVVASPLVFEQPHLYEPHVSEYKYSKSEYAAEMKRLVNEVLYEREG